MEYQLIFDPQIKHVWGKAQGKKVYKQQLKRKINFAEPEIVIVFPDNIEYVTASFTQGLFAEIIKKLGADALQQTVYVKASGFNVEQMYEDAKR